jgi:hypothetical protein
MHVGSEVVTRDTAAVAQLLLESRKAKIISNTWFSNGIDSAAEGLGISIPALGASYAFAETDSRTTGVKRGSEGRENGLKLECEKTWA